jgi:transcriptional regulator with XRE-family HTH domain
VEEPAGVKSLRSREHQHLIQLLIAARAKVGLTQQELADRLGRPQSFVAKYETGERRLDVVEFIFISRELGLDAAKAVREIGGHYEIKRLP